MCTSNSQASATCNTGSYRAGCSWCLDMELTTESLTPCCTCSHLATSQHVQNQQNKLRQQKQASEPTRPANNSSTSNRSAQAAQAAIQQPKHPRHPQVAGVDMTQASSYFCPLPRPLGRLVLGSSSSTSSSSALSASSSSAPARAADLLPQGCRAFCCSCCRLLLVPPALAGAALTTSVQTFEHCASSRSCAKAS